MKKRLLTVFICLTAILSGCRQQIDVTLGNYKEIPVTITQHEITDSDVKQLAETEINYYNMNAVSDRVTVLNGDAVYVTASLYDDNDDIIDGWDNISGYVYTGTGQTFTEIEDAIIGKKAGDTFTVQVMLPGPYEFDSLLDKTEAKAEVTIQYVHEDAGLSLDTITDNQVKEAFGYSDVQAFFDEARAALEEQASQDEHDQAYTSICEYLLSTCDIAISEKELETRTDAYIVRAENACKTYYGMDFSEYLESMNTTEKDFREAARESVEEDMKIEQILDTIGDTEKISYEESDYQSYLEENLSDMGYDSLEDLYENYSEEYVRNAFREEQVIEWLIEHADITYVSEGNNQ